MPSDYKHVAQSNQMSIGEDWDLQKYRKRNEEELAAEEEKRLATLSLYNGEEAGSGGGRASEDGTE